MRQCKKARPIEGRVPANCLPPHLHIYNHHCHIYDHNQIYTTITITTAAATTQCKLQYMCMQYMRQCYYIGITLVSSPDLSCYNNIVCQVHTVVSLTHLHLAWLCLHDQSKFPYMTYKTYVCISLPKCWSRQVQIQRQKT